MGARTWLFATLALAAVGGAAIAAVNVWIDPYGLFRECRGCRLPVYGDERVAKYLLSSRYVPENFNAVLIGTSVSANWNMSGIQGWRVYNESVNGGNIVEEKSLLDAALSRPGIQLAFLIVHPYFTSSHDFKTMRLTPGETRVALGSRSLLAAYTDEIKIRFHRAPQAFDEYGTNDFVAPGKELNPTLRALMKPHTDFSVDPVALAAYRDVVTELRAHNVKIVFVVPPIAENLLESKRAAFGKYMCIIGRNITPQDMLIDFTSDEYTSFRRDRSHFADGIHVYHDAAAVVVSLINARLR